jgi:hypothetical protein
MLPTLLSLSSTPTVLDSLLVLPQSPYATALMYLYGRASTKWYTMRTKNRSAGLLVVPRFPPTTHEELIRI